MEVQFDKFLFLNTNFSSKSGGFETGSIFSVAYDGSYISTMGDVIVVTIQYRLGSFGFLYGQTEDTPGNAGLYDQIQALKWIRENIAAFGGDPHQVSFYQNFYS